MTQQTEQYMRLNSTDPEDVEKRVTHPTFPADKGCEIIFADLMSRKGEDPTRWTEKASGNERVYTASEEVCYEIEKAMLDSRKNNVGVPLYPAEIVIHCWSVAGADKRIWLVNRTLNSQCEKTRIDEGYFLMDSASSVEKRSLVNLHERCTIGSSGHLDASSLWIRNPGEDKPVMRIPYGDQIWPWAAFFPERFLGIARLQKLHDLRIKDNALTALSKDTSATVRFAANRQAEEGQAIIDQVVLELIRSL